MTLINSLQTHYRAVRKSTADYLYWKKFSSRLHFKDDRWYIVCPQGIGDTYFACALLKAFLLTKKCKKVVVIVKKSHLDVARLFPNEISEIVTFDYFRLAVLSKKSECRPGRTFVLHPSQLREDLDVVLGTGGVNLLDLYRKLLGLEENVPLSQPNVHPQSIKNALERLKANNLPVGKTVILAPDARSTSMVPFPFWCDLAKRLNQIGWRVCTNTYHDSECIPNTWQLQFPLDEAIPIVEQAGWMISMRSGLCDLVSTAKCHLSVIYPKEKWYAGTPWSATSLIDMGLSVRALEYEISTPDVSNSDDLQRLSKMIVHRKPALIN